MKNEVIVSDEVWLPPEKRNIGMVFQDYALFPHLTVEKNIAFGLGKNDLEKGRLKEVIDMCNLSGLINKFPQELSGGCLLYTSPSPRDKRQSRMPSSA